MQTGTSPDSQYWDPKQGVRNLCRDMHLVGRHKCPNNCVYCAAGIPRWSEEEYYRSHAWALGFFDHPDHRDDLIKVVSIGTSALQFPAKDTDFPFRIPRMGVSLSPTLDAFYDRYLGIASVNSMSTERMISKLKFQIGGLSNINTDRVNFRYVQNCGSYS